MGLYFGLGGTWTMPTAMIVSAAYMFIPMICAIVVQKLVYKEPLKEPLGISWRINRWWFVAWLSPAVLAFAVFGISLLFPGVEYSPDMSGLIDRFRQSLPPEQITQVEEQLAMFSSLLIWITLFQGLIAGITINAVAGFGEELGWRGLLQHGLSSFGFWKSSALIGLVWGVWHAPLILHGHNYPQHPVGGVFMMIAWCLLLSPLFSYIRLKSKSVIAAAILHGSLNGTAGLALVMVSGGSDLVVGITGASGFIVLAVLNLGIFLYERHDSKRSGIIINEN
jgi:membrane protease YdiL (CAAX protease family)